MFEACAAAASTLQQDESRGRLRVALRSLTIAAPLVLDPVGGKTVLLECTVHASGTLELSSRPAAASRPQTHCRSSVGKVSADAAAAARSSQPRQASAAARSAAAALHWQQTIQRSGSVSASLAASGASGYFLHPAAMDSTLHLSAAAAAAAGGATGQVTRVPTGLSCLLVAQAPVSGGLHPIASPQAASPQPDGSMRCSFKLLAAPDEAAAFELRDLIVKEMPAAQPAVDTTAVSAQNAQQAPVEAGVLYEVQWQAANSRAPTELVSSPTAAESALHADFSTAGWSAPSAAEAAMKGLEFFQKASAAGVAFASLRLTTRGAFQPLPAAGQQQEGAAAAAGAALAALAKVAANEFPAAGISSMDIGSSAPAVVLNGSTKVRRLCTAPHAAWHAPMLRFSELFTSHSKALCSLQT